MLWLGILIGGVVGFLGACLFTSKSTKKLEREIFCLVLELSAARSVVRSLGHSEPNGSQN